MTHFVSDPEPSEYWVPRISTMSIPAKNGKANINVWYPGSARIKLCVESQHPRFKYYPNDRGKPHKKGLRRFVVEGLITGDRIAVFEGGSADDDTSSSGSQQTAWLVISAVKIDKHAPLAVSSHRHNISIDTFGLNSANYPMDGGLFVKKIDNAIGRIQSNPIGRLILDAVTGSVVIFFTESNKIPTAATTYGPTNQKVIALESTYLQGSHAPGASLDEVILHEFAHHADGYIGTYINIGDGLDHDKSDFFTVTVTNVYASIYHRPLRKDHIGFANMIRLYQGSAGEAKFSHAYTANFATVRSAIGSTLYNALVFADAPWNPFP